MKTLNKTRCSSQTCTECAKRKSPTQHRQAPRKIVTSSSSLQRVVVDILGPLPETSNHNKYLLIVGDYFTKWTEAYPMRNMEAQTVARILTNEFITRFGVPEVLHTDQGANFESTQMKELCATFWV